MKRKITLILLSVFVTALTVKAQDNYLQPQRYMLHKGDTLNLHLIYGDQYKNDGELKYDASITSKFLLNDGSKKVNVIKASKDSAAPVLSYVLNTVGMVQVAMVRNIPSTPYDRDTYAHFLSDEGQVKLAETVNNSNQSRFKEKKVCYMKTLLMVDKPTGGDFDKPLGDDYEIVLKKNPYKLNYGDDVTAVFLIKGKPAKAIPIDLYIKTSSGNIYPQRLTTDEKGEFSVTVSREGTYLLRSVQTTASTSKDADFESVQTAYTFLFNSQNDSPNSFKEFGLGDLH